MMLFFFDCEKINKTNKTLLSLKNRSVDERNELEKIKQKEAKNGTKSQAGKGQVSTHKTRKIIYLSAQRPEQLRGSEVGQPTILQMVSGRETMFIVF